MLEMRYQEPIEDRADDEVCKKDEQAVLELRRERALYGRSYEKADDEPGNDGDREPGLGEDEICRKEEQSCVEKRLCEVAFSPPCGKELDRQEEEEDRERRRDNGG